MKRQVLDLRLHTWLFYIQSSHLGVLRFFLIWKGFLPIHRILFHQTEYSLYRISFECIIILCICIFFLSKRLEIMQLFLTGICMMHSLHNRLKSDLQCVFLCYLVCDSWNFPIIRVNLSHEVFCQGRESNMFGYVIVNKPELKIKDFDTYQSFYCGMHSSLRSTWLFS